MMSKPSNQQKNKNKKQKKKYPIFILQSGKSEIKKFE
jgi:hypothetical protein